MASRQDQVTSDDSAPPARPGEKLHSSIAVKSAWLGRNAIVCRTVKDITFDTVMSLVSMGAETVGTKEKIEIVSGGTLHFYVKEKEAGQQEDKKAGQKEDENAGKKEDKNPNKMPGAPYNWDFEFPNSEDEKSDNDK